MKKKELERKMVEYRRFLKDDYDWDYVYILRLLQYKLSRTRKCIVSNNIVVSAKKIGGQIQKVEDLLNRVIKDRYYDQISESFHKKYGALKMITFPPEKGAQSTPVVFRYQKENPRNSERIHREGMRLHQKAEKMRMSDLRKAFHLMNKNIWGWWD